MELEAFALGLGAVSAIYALTWFKNAVSVAIEMHEKSQLENRNFGDGDDGAREICMTMTEYRRLKTIANNRKDEPLAKLVKSIHSHGRRTRRD